VVAKVVVRDKARDNSSIGYDRNPPLFLEFLEARIDGIDGMFVL
jgi:hypothetical protein